MNSNTLIYLFNSFLFRIDRREGGGGRRKECGSSFLHQPFQVYGGQEEGGEEGRRPDETLNVPTLLSSPSSLLPQSGKKRGREGERDVRRATSITIILIFGVSKGEGRKGRAVPSSLHNF